MTRKTFSFLIPAILLIACTSSETDPYALDPMLCAQLVQSDDIHKLMKEIPENSGMYRWESKQVLETRFLPLVEHMDSVIKSGVGEISADMTVSHSGKGSVRLDIPASKAVKNPTNRSYGSGAIVRTLSGEDISEWNRFSCWVYVDAPGYYISFLSFCILNGGEHPMPAPDRFEGEHCVSVTPGEWTHIIWELPDIYRDKAEGFSCSIMMTGEPAGASSEMHLYVDDMRLEKVEAENSCGFDLRDNAIAYSHNGYRIGTRKQALVQNVSSLAFKVRDDVTGRVAFKGKGSELENGFVSMDFSALDKQGRYTIEIDGLHSKPFFIGSAAYLATAWHIINFYFGERCGFDQPGIHQPCHEDVTVQHPDGRSISIAGGWHDAADLSQGVGNTAESGVALLEMAESVKDVDARLYERLLEEARWGLNWVLKTRFGDGYRANGIIIGIWTQNITGDKDDMTSLASRNPMSNFRTAEFEAMAVDFFKDSDPVFANWCRSSAIADFDYAAADIDNLLGSDGTGLSVLIPFNCDTELYAIGMTSAMRLYQMSGDSRYIDKAAEYARHVMAAQDMETHPDWSMPLTGFFYENEDRIRPVEYYHQSQEQRMVQGLAMLLKAALDHPEAEAWTRSLKGYSGYLKSISGVMEPYGLLPAAVYEIDNTPYLIPGYAANSLGFSSIDQYNEQVCAGIPLTDKLYLRRFPIGYRVRGFNATALAKAKAAFILADTFDDREMLAIATRQVEWITGYNPFAMDTIYGDGYDYPLLYFAYAGNLVGSVPVGIQTFEEIDEPYFPMQANCTYKEIWLHSTARMLSCVAEMFKL